jgi:hypothetical protein
MLLGWKLTIQPSDVYLAGINKKDKGRLPRRFGKRLAMTKKSAYEHGTLSESVSGTAWQPFPTQLLALFYSARRKTRPLNPQLTINR